jgi:hypothetical protein
MAEHTSSEDKFLHDISTPLSIATGMLEIALEQLETPAHDTASVTKNVKTAFEALLRINAHVVRRRDEL